MARMANQKEERLGKGSSTKTDDFYVPVSTKQKLIETATVTVAKLFKKSREEMYHILQMNDN